jgi:hypothetical protein
MKRSLHQHIGVISFAAAIMLLPISAVSAKKARPKPSGIAALIAPNADSNDDARDAMFKAVYGKAAPAIYVVEEQNYSFSPVAVQPIEGGIFALISMGDSDNNGHAQSGMNAIHYLRKTGAGYKVVGEWMGMGAAGTMGQPALSYALTNKLGKNPYLITQGGGTWQGYTCEWTHLTELTPDIPIERGSFPSGYSNSGEMSNRKRQNIEGIITAAVPDVSFTVRFSGTRKFTQLWVRDEDKYNLKKGYEVPEC